MEIQDWGCSPIILVGNQLIPDNFQNITKLLYGCQYPLILHFFALHKALESVVLHVYGLFIQRFSFSSTMLGFQTPNPHKHDSIPTPKSRFQLNFKV